MHFRMGAVMKNCHVQLTEDCHYYSVPFRYIGEKVKISYNSHEVRIYLKGIICAITPGSSTLPSLNICHPPIVLTVNGMVTSS